MVTLNTNERKRSRKIILKMETPRMIMITMVTTSPMARYIENIYS
jgi:hypothetical protein